MVVRLQPEMEKRVQERVKRGPFASADELVNAALEQFIGEDDLEPGEMENLLSTADAQAQAGQLVDGEEVFRRIAERSRERQQGQ